MENLDAAHRFGKYVTRLARNAGYDVSPGDGGRAAFARATGMSPSTVGRMLDGKTLPQPTQFEAIAQALGADVRDLLVQGGVISDRSRLEREDHQESHSAPARSHLAAAHEAATALGITEPTVRSMLIASITQALHLQHAAEGD